MARVTMAATFATAGCYQGFDGGAPGPGLSGGGASGPDTGAGSGDSSGDSGDPGDDPEASCAGEPLTVGASAMLRLTRGQYANALDDLLGLGPLADSLAAELPADEKLGAFTFNAASVPSLLADAVMRNAEAAADAFVERIGAELPCSAEEADAACAGSFIDSVGPRAYRRPMQSAERDELLALHASGENFNEGIRRVVAALLSSPSFLYRVELGSEEAVPEQRLRLTSFEVATRMSLFLLNTIPDQALLDAAAAGELDTAPGRRAQAERLLQGPRARDAVGRFHAQWLGVEGVPLIERDPGGYPDFDGALAQSMAAETAEFVAHVVFDDDASFRTLMTAPYTIADDDLLRLYGVEPSPGRDEGEPVQLDPQQRAGVLTQASYLAATAHTDQASPILRGVSVRANVLCQGLPPPPPTADDVAPEVDANATTRERFEQHTADPVCAACHVLIDPVGFGFSNYDAIGQFHELENGQPIDASGELTAAGDANGTFDGAVELAARLADSSEVQRCYAEQWFVFANGRLMEEADACELDLAYETFAGDDFDIFELMLTAVESPSFTHRVIAEGTED